MYSAIMHVGKDLVAASATPMVLAILAGGESYGYAIIKRVGELSDGDIRWTDGMLYPLLHRLERLGLVESAWRSAAETGNRRRKYYRLTVDGGEALAEHRTQWRTVNRALDRIWNNANFAPPALAYSRSRTAWA